MNDHSFWITDTTSNHPKGTAWSSITLESGICFAMEIIQAVYVTEHLCKQQVHLCQCGICFARQFRLHQNVEH